MNVSFAILNWKSIIFFKLWFLLLALYFWISFGILRFLFFCLFLKCWRSLDFSFRHSYISQSLAELFSPMTSGSIYMMFEAHTYSLSSRFPYATIRCLHLDDLQDCTCLVFKIKHEGTPSFVPYSQWMVSSPVSFPSHSWPHCPKCRGLGTPNMFSETVASALSRNVLEMQPSKLSPDLLNHIFRSGAQKFAFKQALQVIWYKLGFEELCPTSLSDCFSL